MGRLSAYSLKTSLTASAIILRGTGFMAGYPGGHLSPLFVTLPIPLPPPMYTVTGSRQSQYIPGCSPDSVSSDTSVPFFLSTDFSPGIQTAAYTRAPSVTSGSSPASFLTAQISLLRPGLSLLCPGLSRPGPPVSPFPLTLCFAVSPGSSPGHHTSNTASSPPGVIRETAFSLAPPKSDRTAALAAAAAQVPVVNPFLSSFFSGLFPVSFFCSSFFGITSPCSVPALSPGPASYVNRRLMLPGTLSPFVPSFSRLCLRTTFTGALLL